MSGERSSTASYADELSVPWTRATLHNTPTYVASNNFLAHVEWLKTGNQHELVIANAADPLKEAAYTRATCAVVGTVSSNRLFLEAHRNYNPNFEKTVLETSKAQFQLESPTINPEFEADFSRGVKHIKTLQTQTIREGPKAEHFIVPDGVKRALKFSWPLFEKRDAIYDPTDDEDWTNDYLITTKYKDLFNDIAPKWHATPLPAFDTSGKFIKINDQEASLKGSLVLVYFELQHYPIRNKRTNGITSNTFSATATQVKVLEQGAECCSSTYKSRLLKGLTFLPQSPTKKKDQVATVNAFHPAGATTGTTNGSVTKNHQE